MGRGEHQLSRQYYGLRSSKYSAGGVSASHLSTPSPGRSLVVPKVFCLPDPVRKARARGSIEGEAAIEGLVPGRVAPGCGSVLAGGCREGRERLPPQAAADARLKFILQERKKENIQPKGGMGDGTPPGRVVFPVRFKFFPL